jgi:hypothetical protein
LHGYFARVSKTTFYPANLGAIEFASERRFKYDSTYFHGMRQHSRQSEGNFLGELFAMHGNLKTISEVDVDDFPGASFEQ